MFRIARPAEHFEAHTTILLPTTPETRQHASAMMPKPIVLHLGDAIKYNHEVYNQEFLGRFEVVRNDTNNREDFIHALKNKRLVYTEHTGFRI